MLWQPPVMTTSRYTQSIKLWAGYEVVGNYKRTWQGVSARLILYLYYYMWSMLWLHFYCASYPKVYTSSISAPYIYHEVAMWLTYFLTLLSRLFLTSLNSSSVKIIDGGLHSFLFSLFHFIFLCLLFSIFYF